MWSSIIKYKSFELVDSCHMFFMIDVINWQLKINLWTFVIYNYVLYDWWSKILKLLGACMWLDATRPPLDVSVTFYYTICGSVKFPTLDTAFLNCLIDLNLETLNPDPTRLCLCNFFQYSCQVHLNLIFCFALFCM